MHKSTSDQMIPSDHLIDWLSSFFRSRICNDLDLKFNVRSNRWHLFLPSANQVITFPYFPNLYKLGPQPDLTCPYINICFSESSLNKYPLPAPSLDFKGNTLIISQNNNQFLLEYDVVGLIYWMLSRCEEINCPSTLLDKFDRFPATSSHAFQFGYLERPIIDEWVLVLRTLCNIVFSNIKITANTFNLCLSHDVDLPSAYCLTTKSQYFKQILLLATKNKNPLQALMALYIRLSSTSSLHPSDPYNTFDWLMDLSELANVQSSFYFMVGGKSQIYDSLYDPNNPIIRNLMISIHERGHHIGLHPSFETCDNDIYIKMEAETLRTICGDSCITQEIWGSRQHYLRWKHPNTAYGLSAAGINYDSTLGYADSPGFRCGTCHEYMMFDPIAQKQINLLQRPLIIMESSIINTGYLGLGYSTAAYEKFYQLKHRCKDVSGNFSLLWHNSHFNTDSDRKLYEYAVFC